MRWFNEPPHMAELKQDDQLEPTYSSSEDTGYSPVDLPEAMNERGVSRKSQGYPCWWHNMMIMMMMIFSCGFVNLLPSFQFLIHNLVASLQLQMLHYRQSPRYGQDMNMWNGHIHTGTQNVHNVCIYNIANIGIPKHKNTYAFLVQVRNFLLPLS